MGDLYKKDLETCLQEAKSKFEEKYGEDPNIKVAAPGRVNLIGEHTDYNDGFVLPMAMPLMTVIVGRKAQGPQCCVTSTAAQKAVQETKCQEFPVPQHPGGGTAEVPCEGDPLWIKYVKGVVALMNKNGDVPAFEAVIASSVPLGGGLSSSASLEVAVGLFVEQLLGRQLPRKELALLCQEAEHRYPGNKCGIMDQFISAMGEEGKALLIDCEKGKEHGEQIAMSESKEKPVVWLVADTNVRHQLAGGEYNKRRGCCESAVAKLQAGKSLRFVTMEALEAGRAGLSDLEYRRARHVIGEIKRTTEAAEALKNGDYQKFGNLMYESHYSLKDDYEVSCPELDKLVELAKSQSGVLGSRMTGGGFGGCTVTLLYSDALPQLKKTIEDGYAKFTGGKYEVEFHDALASPGGTVL